MRYLCVDTWTLEDGNTICTAGRFYEVIPVAPADGETEEDVAGYCDILDCDDGRTTETTFLEVEEHMELVG